MKWGESFEPVTPGCYTMLSLLRTLKGDSTRVNVPGFQKVIILKN